MLPIQSSGVYSLHPAEADEISTPAAADPRYVEKARSAAEKFESFFIADMLHQMRSTTEVMAGEDSVYNNRINRDMLDMADGVVADVMARQHAFGIADTILMQVLPAQLTAGFKFAEKNVAPDQQETVSMEAAVLPQSGENR